MCGCTPLPERRCALAGLFIALIASLAFAVALVLRVAAVAWDWKLPVWLANGEARTRGSWFSSRRQTFYFERPAGESDEANKS